MNRSDHEAAATEAFMKALVQAPFDAGPLPDPSFLWWKAQLLRRWDAEREAAKPIELGERVQIGVAPFGVYILFGALWHFAPPSGGLAIATVLIAMVVLASVAAVRA